jgi:class I fructose-bisphosphate aldolase
MSGNILDNMNIAPGKKARLHRMLYQYGPGNGKMMVLPYDQGLEHGPVDFFVNPDCKDPDYIFELAIKGNYSAIAVQYGVAAHYFPKYAGKIPLILKVNGKTNIPSDASPLSPVAASVEDAVRIGADAIGYTIYVGSPRQDEDVAQFREIREEADRYGIPVIVWSYPRGESVASKGGKDCFYSIDYAARVAMEYGADVVKINLPETTSPDSPKPYNEMDISAEEMTRQAVQSAGKALVLISGGSKVSDEDLINKVELSMKGGATGLIFGRNMWQRPMAEALEMTKKMQDVMSKY